MRISTFYVGTAFARLLRSYLHENSLGLSSSLLQDITFNMSSSQRLQDFSLLNHVKIASAAFVILLDKSFGSSEILLFRTYSGSFWRVSESRYSLISIQYWQLHRLILSCSLRYCISLCYWSDVVHRVFCNVLFQLFRGLVFHSGTV